MNTDDALSDYQALRAKGWTHAAALAELGTYLRPTTLARLQARLRRTAPLPHQDT